MRTIDATLIRIIATAAILVAITSPAFSARLNLGCTDNPDLIYDPATGNVRLVPGTGEKNKIVQFVLANATGAFTPEPDEVFKSRTPWEDIFYDNLPKEIASADLTGTGSAVGQEIDLGNIFPTGMTYEGLYDLLIQADVLWKLGEGGKGALDLCIPEPCAGILAATGLLAALNLGRRRKA
ncbi:MAG: hypothetical protein U0795_08040 [Pirellulales bacterium]